MTLIHLGIMALGLIFILVGLILMYACYIDKIKSQKAVYISTGILAVGTSLFLGIWYLNYMQLL